MSTFARAGYVRFATLLAVALALLLSGVVVGAAGGPLIMGAANSAGTTNTSLTTSSTGTALLVTQTGTGTALRGVAANGIAGFFSSANGSGVSGVVAANNKYGVYGGNDAATFGGGAAVRADGKQNNGVVATTANAAADALRGVNTGGGQALDLVVNAGVAPMSVNSAGLVTNLNADKLDGLDSTGFQARVTGTCAAGSAVGSVGPSGSVACNTGPEGPQGPPGPAGPVNPVIRQGTSVTTNGAGLWTGTASCQGGEKVLGGGVNTSASGSTFDMRLVNSYPSNFYTWSVTVNNQTGSNGQSFIPYAVCGG